MSLISLYVFNFSLEPARTIFVSLISFEIERTRFYEKEKLLREHYYTHETRNITSSNKKKKKHTRERRQLK